MFQAVLRHLEHSSNDLALVSECPSTAICRPDDASYELLHYTHEGDSINVTCLVASSEMPLRSCETIHSDAAFKNLRGHVANQPVSQRVSQSASRLRLGRRADC